MEKVLTFFHKWGLMPDFEALSPFLFYNKYKAEKEKVMANYKVETAFREGRIYENSENSAVLTLDLDRKNDMNPGSALLAALGTCKLASFIELKDKYRIRTGEVKVTVKGETGTEESENKRQPRSSFKTIEISYSIETDHTEDEISEFLKYVDLACTIGNSLSDSIEIKTSISLYGGV